MYQYEVAAQKETRKQQKTRHAWRVFSFLLLSSDYQVAFNQPRSSMALTTREMATI